MSTQEFKNAWDGLSDIQREAATWNTGPLLVLAGPGSGKTRVLTTRIARLLDSSSSQNFRVLGLTFTNKAADEMRSRVTAYVPGQESRLFLGTFHSFCADILRQHGTHLGISPAFQIYSLDNDLNAVLSEAVDQVKKKYDFVSDLDRQTLNVIQWLKSRLIPPERTKDAFRDEAFGSRMAVVYPAYEAELARRNALDFNSLVFKTFLLFSKFPAIANRYRTVFPYVCVDEFQDTNEAQYLLMRAFTGNDYKNLFIVADDDQIIYQWNGASHKRLEQLKNDYSPDVIQLPMNYRCPYDVVVMANRLISHNVFRVADKKPLQAFRGTKSDGTVRLLPVFDSLDDEADGVAEDIKELHEIEFGSVAVLARSRKLLDVISSACGRIGVPAAIAQRKSEFESTPFVWLHSTLRLANDRQNEEYLEAVCGSFAQLSGLKIDPAEVMIAARASNKDYLQYWTKIALQNSEDDSAKEMISKVSHYLNEVKEYRAFCKSAFQWIDSLVDISSDNAHPGTIEFFGYDEERSVWERLDKEISLSIGDSITLEAFLQELQMHSKETPIQTGNVTLMTIHSAKGKEFDHVYLVGLVEDELPSFQSRKQGNGSPEMEEERRNCFVAITRTVKTLTLSYAAKYRGWTKEPSRFLSEMGLL